MSDATQETVQDLLGYSATELEQLFDIFNVDVLGKKRIKREMDGMRALIEPEPEEEPEPETSQVLVVGGGEEPEKPLNTAEVYDPQSNSWSSVAPMGSKRAGAAAAVLPGPRVLVVGGMDESQNALSTAEVYDPQSNSWSSVAPMGTKRHRSVGVGY